MRCGYPASSIRERIYADEPGGRFGILLYTGSPDAEGTLGGLVQQARHIEDHLAQALRTGRALLERPDLRPARARARAWRSAGSTAPPATAARSSPRPPARCATTTSTGRSSCRCSASRARPSSARAHDRRPARPAGPPPQAARERARVGPARAAVLGHVAPVGGERCRGEPGDRRRRWSSSTAAGCRDRAVAEILGVADRMAARAPRPDLVWSGPEVPGLHARDTRRVYEELLGTAERSVWASTYAFFDGPRAFEVLAKRMDARPGLQVTLLLNIQRKRGDTTAADQLVRRFADRFWAARLAGHGPPEGLLRPARARARTAPAACCTPRPSSSTTRRSS